MLLRRSLIAFVALAALAVLAPRTASADHATTEDDPPYSVDLAELDAATDCTEFTHPEHEPVLLVHGTFTHGHEQFDWNWALLLAERGYDFCIVTYPDRGMGDIQVASEYIVRAVENIHATTGSKVDIMGHSQGGLEPRWAVKWWPSVRDSVDDLVMVATPNHGTNIGQYGLDGASMNDQPASFHQMAQGSTFLEVLNGGDETPGEVSYTSLYTTLKDELVQPDAPVPTAGLDWGTEGANVRNLAVQELCPGRPVDHLGIGTTDLAAIDLVLDAFDNPGPVDPERLDPVATCLQGHYGNPGQLPAMLDILAGNMTGGFPEFHQGGEPEIKDYAQPPQESPEQAAGSADGSEPVSTPRGDTGASLPATGVEVPLVAGMLLLTAGLATKALRAPVRP